MEDYNEYEEDEEQMDSPSEVSSMYSAKKMTDLVDKKELNSDQKVSIAKANEMKRRKMQVATFRKDYDILKAQITVMDKSLGRNAVPRRSIVNKINLARKSDKFQDRFGRGFVSADHWNLMESLFRIDQDVVPELVILNEFLIEGLKQVANIVDISSTIDSSDRLLSQIETIVETNGKVMTKIIENVDTLNKSTISHLEDRISKDMVDFQNRNDVNILGLKRSTETINTEVFNLVNKVNVLENAKPAYQNISQATQQPVPQPTQQPAPQPIKQPAPQPIKQPVVLDDRIEEDILADLDLTKDNPNIPSDEANNKELFDDIEKKSNLEPGNSGFLKELNAERSKNSGVYENDSGEKKPAERMAIMKQITKDHFETKEGFAGLALRIKEEFAPDATEKEILKKFRNKLKRDNS